MKDLIIVCAGGFGKEVAQLVEWINARKPQWRIVGYIDDTKPVGTEIYNGYKVIGSIDGWQRKGEEYLAMGNSNPKSKEMLYNKLKARGADFATLIAPDVAVRSDIIVDEGSIISLAWLGADVKIGKCVNIAGSMAGECEIGDFSTTTGFANIAGAKLGKRVFVGSHAVVLNGRRVGDDAFICAGSICFNHIKPGVKVMGNPAKKIEI